MTLLGLATQQLGLIFAVAGIGLTTLYLLKQQRRRVDVPFIRLWQQVLQRSEATSWWRRLLRLLSLLIQLVVLALLVLSLGDPRLGRSQRGRTLVLLIDASASMQARLSAAGGRELSRLQAAQAQARDGRLWLIERGHASDGASGHGLLLPDVLLPPSFREVLRLLARETAEGWLVDQQAWPLAQALFERLGVRLSLAE